MRCHHAGNAPRYATALPGHFEMYEKAGQLDKAVRLYRDALAQQPEMPEALLNLGRILESNGKSDEARACRSRALEVEPALAQGYFGPSMD
jgi:tetratricopeptide (TPR) repeat protein